MKVCFHVMIDELVRTYHNVNINSAFSHHHSWSVASFDDQKLVIKQSFYREVLTMGNKKWGQISSLCVNVGFIIIRAHTISHHWKAAFSHVNNRKMSEWDLNPRPLSKTRTRAWRLRPLAHPELVAFPSFLLE